MTLQIVYLKLRIHQQVAKIIEQSPEFKELDKGILFHLVITAVIIWI